MLGFAIEHVAEVKAEHIAEDSSNAREPPSVYTVSPLFLWGQKGVEIG